MFQALSSHFLSQSLHNLILLFSELISSYFTPCSHCLNYLSFLTVLWTCMIHSTGPLHLLSTNYPLDSFLIFKSLLICLPFSQTSFGNSVPYYISPFYLHLQTASLVPLLSFSHRMCYGLNCVQKGYVEVSNPMPVKVVLFGNRGLEI